MVKYKTDMGRENNYCIIMAGGVGSRFWPVSRNDKPKQFLDFFGTGISFLQQTYNRFAKIIPNENIFLAAALAAIPVFAVFFVLRIKKFRKAKLEEIEETPVVEE